MYITFYYRERTNNQRAERLKQMGGAAVWASARSVNSISLLRLSLLRFADSNFPGNSLWT